MKHSKIRESLVRVLAIMLVFTLLTVFPVGCRGLGIGGGGGTGGGDTGGTDTGDTASLQVSVPDFMSEKVSLPQSPAAAVAAQDICALATQQYITARLFLDTIIDFNIKYSKIEDFAWLYDETIHQFELAEQFAEQALAAGEVLQAYGDSS